MNQNISTTSEGGRRIIGRLLAVVSIVFLLSVAFACGVVWQKQEEAFQARQATVDVERALTDLYGEEVRLAIERYVSIAHSFDAMKDPNILSEVMTGPHLETLSADYLQGLSSTPSYENPSWYVTRTATVRSVRVLEYTPQQFRAIGCGVLYIDKVTPQGEYIESLRPWEFRDIFVSVRENGTWKFAVSYDTMDPADAIREWGYQADWVKELIPFRDLSNHAYKDCDLDP